jgi:hypothetical protein
MVVSRNVWKLLLGLIILVLAFESLSILHSNNYYNYTDFALVEASSISIPDRIFPCSRKGNDFNCHTRKHTVEKLLNNSRVVIASTIRDNEQQIGNIRPAVERVAAQFKEAAILIVENDSEDDTRGELLKWSQENPAVKVLGCEVNSPSCKMNFVKTVEHAHYHSRILKMATIRNKYMEYLKTHYSDWDYLIVWDIDIEGTMFMEGIYNTLDKFQNDKSIDGICSFGVRLHFWLGWVYYDPFAHEELAGDPSGVNHDVYIQMKLWWDMQRGDPLHPVRSCFGGMTTYRISSIMATNTTYRYSNPENPVKCEHTYFHEPLKMYLNPSQVYAVIKN